MNLYRSIIEKLKRLWMRLALRGVRYSDNHSKIDLIYLATDPWDMSSAVEEYRFRAINRLIAENFGRVSLLLEIGCGEGHQSVYLGEVCDRLVGLDISARAVDRARRRCPQGEFLIDDILSPQVDARAPFDLVIASEVLYYMSDVPAVLRRMRALGRNSLVTYFSGEMGNLDRYVLAQPGVTSSMLEFEGARWRVAWWRGELR